MNTEIDGEVPLDQLAADLIHSIGTYYGYAGHDVLRHKFTYPTPTGLPGDLCTDEERHVTLLGIINTLLVRCGLERVICLIGTDGVWPVMAAGRESVIEDILNAKKQVEGGKVAEVDDHPAVV